MQCFTVLIAMEFVHACCLNLYLQFQCPGQRRHTGRSARRRSSKRVRSTAPEVAAPRRSTAPEDILGAVPQEKGSLGRHLERETPGG